MDNKNKYSNGYHKIIDTEKNVEGMKDHLTDLKPKLKDAAE